MPTITKEDLEEAYRRKLGVPNRAYEAELAARATPMPSASAPRPYGPPPPDMPPPATERVEQPAMKQFTPGELMVRRGLGKFSRAISAGNEHGVHNAREYLGMDTPVQTKESMAEAAQKSAEPQTVDKNGATFAPEPQREGPGQTSGGGGGGYVAPHMGVTSRSTQKGIQLDPETLAAQQSMTAHGHNANTLEAAGATQEREQAGQLAAKEDAYATAQRAQQHIDEGRRGLERFDAEQEVRDKKYQLAQTPATVDEYFSKKGTAGKVFNIIGRALGGLAQGLKGGENPFLASMNAEIAGQMGKKRDELNFAQQGLRDADGKIDRARVDDARKYMQGLDAVRMQMKAMALKSKDPRILANLERNEAALDKEQVTIGAHLKEVQSDKTVEHESLMGGGMIGGGSGGGGVGEKSMSNVFKDPATGQAYVARNVEGAKLMSASLAATENIKQQASEYQKILSQLSAKDRLSSHVGMPTEKMARATDLYNGILGEVRQQNNDGVWKKSETELLTSTLQPPDKLLGGQSGAQAGQLAHQANMLTQNLMKTHSPLPVKEGWGRDKTGEPIPTAHYTGGQFEGTKGAPAMPTGFKPVGGR